MGSVSDEAFEQLLAEDLSWRRIEMNLLKDQLSFQAGKSATSPATRAFSRSLTAMLYAHWEGFVKCVFEHYTELIVRRKPNARLANDSLLTSHVLQLLRRVESGDSAAREEVLKLVRDGFVPRLRLTKRSMSETKSNLRFDTLRDIFDGLGVPLDQFRTKERLIDVLLCDRRNAIAHGRSSFPKAEDVVALHADVLQLMEAVQDLVISQVRSKAYLAA